MNLRPAHIDDYEELVSMYNDLLDICYQGYEKGAMIYIYGAVIEWFKQNKFITICETDNGDIAGFSLSYVEQIGVIQPYLYGDSAYLKPEYRKTRGAYLLYNEVVNRGKEMNIPVQAKAFVGDGNENKVDKIQSRWGSPQFVEYSTVQKERINFGK